MYSNGLKRVLDCALSLPVLIVGAIPMGLVAAAIKLDSPGPVLFRQERLGKDGKASFKPGSAGSFTIRTYVKDGTGKTVKKDFSLTAV